MMNFAEYIFKNSKGSSGPALLEGDRIMTYPELFNKVNSLARLIFTLYGNGREILLMAENSFFFAICYLAIIKSGNTVILIETRISDASLIQIRETCSISAYFVQGTYAARFADVLPNLYSEEILDSRQAVTHEYPLIGGDRVAVIIFTSGSTGTKKGVMLTHKNLIANTDAIVEYLRLSSVDRICVVLPFYYCYGASLLHTHLRVGGSIVISRLVFPTQTIRDLHQYHCTGFAGVPTTYQLLINKTSFLKENFDDLRYMTQAGGQLSRTYIEKILSSFPAIEFYVMYGMTEATARLSFLTPDRAFSKIGSIGRGIPGVTLEVIDRDGYPVKPGEIGEITARGDNIMKGYYKDPQGTAQAIRKGVLFTGDLATVDDEGFIYIMGRLKNLIKSAGYRISPLEIEDFISSIPHVQGCVVIGVPDDIMGEAVVAIVQTDIEDIDSFAAGILAACSRQFPPYKVPKFLDFVRGFPLNSSQKIDRHRIKEQYLSKRDSALNRE